MPECRLISCDVSQLAFLGLAVLVSAIGITILWLRQRRPQLLEFGIDRFSREREALALSTTTTAQVVRARSRSGRSV